MLRALVYLTYSSVVVFCVARFFRAALGDAFGVFVVVAVLCALCGAATFAASSLAHRRRWGVLADYLFALAGRTGVPCCMALICATTRDDASARVLVLRLFVLYALTAPMHVFLTLPRSSRVAANTKIKPDARLGE